MTKLSIAPLLLICLLQPSPAQGQDPSAWAGDIELLLAGIDALHPDPYRLHSREEWQVQAGELKQRLPGLEPHVAQLEFKRLLGLAGDGHSYFRPGGEGWGEPLYYPLFLRRFADGWYVRTGHLDHEGLFGRRVVSLGELEIDELCRRLEPYVGSPNRMRALDVMPSLLRLPQVLHTVGAIENIGDPLPITVVDAAGVHASGQLVASPDWISDEFVDADHAVPTPKPAYRDFDRNFDHVVYREHDAMYFYFGEVRDEDDESLAAYSERLFADFASSGVTRMVVDLRENNGGNLYLYQPLLHEIIRQRFAPGELFVLIGRDTWSAAMAFAVQLERETSAIFVGEPTPSPPNFFGDTEPIALPASGIVVECSALRWQFSDPRDERPWIAPDVPVAERFADFLAHRDVCLEAVWAYRYTGERLAPGSEESYELPTHVMPAIRWQRESQGSYDSSWMY